MIFFLLYLKVFSLNIRNLLTWFHLAVQMQNRIFFDRFANVLKLKNEEPVQYDLLFLYKLTLFSKVKIKTLDLLNFEIFLFAINIDLSWIACQN